MNHSQSRVKALVEVLCVFALIILAWWIMEASPLGRWESQVLGRRYLHYIVMMVILVGFMIVTQKDLANYGIFIKNLKYHLGVAATCFIPVAAMGVSLIFLNWKRWDGALMAAAIEVAVLLVIAWLLRSKPAASSLVIGAFLLVASGIALARMTTVGNTVTGVIFYFVFVGPGEEMLFRGYIQSRLNQAFGRPYRFFDASWGWGVIIAALIFGLMHVLNTFNPLLGKFDLSWTWGFWTFFAGLVFGYVRERTSGVIAPAILHGVLNFL